mmetsp:Transcript_30271/g.37127  ORF Transcript_30271/g.37127 Transcript_30271/m.37127 type:complete len:149 (+) Transcript_30271:100-546(+)
MLYEPMSQPSGYAGGYLHGPSLWSWETHSSISSQIPLPTERPKRGSEVSEDWDVLAPMKKLRLTEALPVQTEDMAVDDAERSPPASSPSAMTDSEDARKDAAETKTGSRGDASQERRAKIQQRALEEMRKYRQALRNCESGMVIRDCP